MELNREPTAQEKKLIEFLVRKSSIIVPDNWKERLLVRFMDDGQMGSLYLFPQGITSERRLFGQQVSECQFTDSDGIEVIVSLYVDNEGGLFELDIWKTNFEKLIKLPDI